VPRPERDALLRRFDPVSRSGLRAEPAEPEGDVRGRRRLRAGDILLLIAPAVWAGTHVPARNPVGIPHFERLLSVAALLAILAILVAWILIGLTRRRREVVHGVFLACLFLVSGGPFVRQLGLLGGISLVVVAVALLVWITARLTDSAIPTVIVVGAAAFFLSGPLTDGVTALIARGPDLLSHPVIESGQLDSRGDVYLVVLDGFPGSEALQLDYGSAYSRELIASFERRGFDVPQRATAAYPSTNYSIPSLLSMGYPVTDDELSNATLQSLYDVISGDNPVVQAFSASGYATYMVEAGWSGSSCRSWYDHCVASNWMDDPVYFLSRDSLLTSFLSPVTGSNYPTNSLATMQWLVEEAIDIGDEQRAFFFAHVLAPHPPLMLDASCSVVLQEERSGYYFPRPNVSEEDRSEYLKEQVSCVTRFMHELVDSVRDEDVVIFVADHGTDRRGQLFKDPDSWTEEDITERMSTFVAVRTPTPCPFDDDVHLPNVMRRVLSCLGSVTIPEVDEQTFLFIGDN